MLPFRDTELRSSANSLTRVSHSGCRTPRRRLAAYPAVNRSVLLPGIEKRLARYSQLYGRIGFVHGYRTSSADKLA